MDALEQRVLAAQTDGTMLDLLIVEEKRWILQCAAQAARRYVTDRDGEWSAALPAFREAVMAYAPEKGSFRAFASAVIQRRVADYLQSEARQGGVVHTAPGALGGETEADGAAGSAARARHRAAEDPAAAAREEIAAVQELLAWYGFSLFDLADCSPQGERAKKSCAAAVRTLLRDPVLMERLRRTHTLPLRELSSLTGVEAKVLDRYRKYLIAAAEILDGEFPTLRGYLRYIREEGDQRTKAIVLETRNGAAAALREDGAVVRTRRMCAVGETVELGAELLQFPGKKTAEKKKTSQRALRAAVAVAAALVILGSGGYTYAVVAAASYVSLDVGDASVELTLNRLGRVISVRALNRGGEELAEPLSAGVRDRPAAEAMELALTCLKEEGYLDGGNSEVIAGITDGNAARSARLAETVTQSMERGGVRGAAVETSSAERREAGEQGIGAGRYASEQREKPEETVLPRYLETDVPAGGPPAERGFSTPAPLETPSAGSFHIPGPPERGAEMTPPPGLSAQGPNGADITPPPALPAGGPGSGDMALPGR